MKKMIFAAVVAALALVSCSKEENRSCFKVEYTIPAQEAVVDADGATIRAARPETKIETYKWSTDAEIDACRKNWEAMGYKNIFTAAVDKDEASGKSIKTMADCLSKK